MKWELCLPADARACGPLEGRPRRDSQCWLRRGQCGVRAWVGPLSAARGSYSSCRPPFFLVLKVLFRLWTCEAFDSRKCTWIQIAQCHGNVHNDWVSRCWPRWGQSGGWWAGGLQRPTYCLGCPLSRSAVYCLVLTHLHSRLLPVAASCEDCGTFTFRRCCSGWIWTLNLNSRTRWFISVNKPDPCSASDTKSLWQSNEERIEDFYLLAS